MKPRIEHIEDGIRRKRGGRGFTQSPTLHKWYYTTKLSTSHPKLSTFPPLRPRTLAIFSNVATLAIVKRASFPHVIHKLSTFFHALIHIPSLAAASIPSIRSRCSILDARFPSTPSTIHPSAASRGRLHRTHKNRFRAVFLCEIPEICLVKENAIAGLQAGLKRKLACNETARLYIPSTPSAASPPHHASAASFTHRAQSTDTPSAASPSTPSHPSAASRCLMPCHPSTTPSHPSAASHHPSALDAQFHPPSRIENRE